MKRAKLSLLCLFILLTLLCATLVGFRGIGRWLIREDPLSPADAIVVLSGSLPYPAEEAGKIFRMSYAPEVWVSRPDNPAAELEKLGIHFVADEEYNREVLIHAGVPEAALHILPDTVVDTEQEIKEVAQEMHRTGKTRFIIVTSPERTRRVRRLWNRLVGGSPKVVVRAAHEDPYDADHWWRNTDDRSSVVREIVALMNDWAGVPARPHLL
jgi:uncharacterized SAM-binding protein YcdF (DUF218 family)